MNEIQGKRFRWDARGGRHILATMGAGTSADCILVLLDRQSVVRTCVLCLSLV